MTKNLIILTLIIACLILAVDIIKMKSDIDRICHEKFTGATSNDQYATCVSIVDAMQEIASAHEYEKDVYDCSQFSEDLSKKLLDIGINNELVVGNYDENKEIGHVWVGVWIEPITGTFISTASSYYENYGGIIRTKNGKVEWIRE